MKSKVLKIGTVLLTCVCLFSFMILPVSALNSNGATLTGVAASFDDGTGINASVNNYTDYIEVIGNGAYGTTEVSIRYQFESPNNYGRFSIVVKPIYGNISLVNSGYNGIYIDNKKDDNWFMGYGTYGANTVDFYYEGYIPKNFNTKIFYNMTNYSAENTYTYYVVQFTFIPIDKGSQDVINNQNQNTQSIINNQNSNRQEITSNNNWNTDREIQADKENTDKIVNGWEGAENLDDSTANNYKDTESAALGGKSDADIQNEVNSALSFDIGSFDSIKVGKIHSLFDRLLAVTGGWQSLFVLSLTLGLGAFLIGRRYG